MAAIAARLIADGHPIGEVNVGGGLGVPARTTEAPVDLDAYAAALARHLGPLGVAVGCEPGDYIAKDAAILLGEVVTVEERGGTQFVGLDLGWNVNCSYFIYRYAQEIVVCRAADAPRTEIVTVAGHINEAGDVFAEDYPIQPVVEGDIVALLNAGGYHEAMSSTHCLRPMAERDLPRPLVGAARRDSPSCGAARSTILMIGRCSSRWLAYCGYLVRSAATATPCSVASRRLVGLEELRAAVQSEPSERRPVLRPGVDQERHVRVGGDVANPLEVVRIGDALGLLVQRRPDPQRHVRGVEREADRDESRPAIGAIVPRTADRAAARKTSSAWVKIVAGGHRRMMHSTRLSAMADLLPPTRHVTTTRIVAVRGAELEIPRRPRRRRGAARDPGGRTRPGAGRGRGHDADARLRGRAGGRVPPDRGPDRGPGGRCGSSAATRPR